MSEFNNENVNEFGKIKSYPAPNEIYVFSGNVTPKEIKTSDEQMASFDKSKRKKKTDYAKLLASVVAVIGSVTVVGSGVMASGGGASSAQILEYGGSYNSVFYYIELERAEDAQIEVVLYNDFTNRSEKLNGIENSGEFYDLVPNREYTLAVIETQPLGKVTLASQTVRTAIYPDYTS